MKFLKQLLKRSLGVNNRVETLNSSITDVSVSLPTLSELLAVLSFRAGYNTTLVVLGSLLLGIAAGLIGCFTLLRKRALMSDALAHSTLPGLAIAFLLATLLGVDGKNLALLLFGASCTAILGVFAVLSLSTHTRLSEDSAVGAVLSVFFAFGIVMLSVLQSLETGSSGGLNHFIYGQTAAMRIRDAYILLAAAAGALCAVLLLRKEFSLICFDPEFAHMQGWPVRRIDILMMALLTVITVIGLQSVGMLLVVALLIIPPAAARFWTERLSTMIILSASFGGLSGYCGAAASALLPRLPAGAVIVLTAGVVFVVSFLLAPQRGLFASFYRLLRLRIRIAKDHLLRDLFEEYERLRLPHDSVLPYHKVAKFFGRTKLVRALVLTLSQLSGLLIHKRQEVRFTTYGLQEARRLIRSHRLWEQYLIEYASLPASHVDYSADTVEHILSPEIIARLEKKLSPTASTPQQEETPDSVHPLGEPER